MKGVYPIDAAISIVQADALSEAVPRIQLRVARRQIEDAAADTEIVRGMKRRHRPVIQFLRRLRLVGCI